MKHTFNTERFVSLVRSKRSGRSLRDVVREMNGAVSISTLSRIERGNVPDMATLLAICDWLGVAASNFIICDLDAGMPNHKISVVDRIRLILLSSKRFRTDVVASLVVLIENLQQPTDM